MASGKLKVLALGSTILDILANVEEEFLSTIDGEKGGMVMIDAETSDRLVARLPSCQKMLGGSAANTLFGLQRLGMPTTMLGKVGTDAEGDFYRSEYARIGGDVSRFKTTSACRTGRCVSLITPDSERTMRTDLGAASTFKVTEITAADFEGVTQCSCRRLHDVQFRRVPACAETGEGCRSDHQS